MNTQARSILRGLVHNVTHGFMITTTLLVGCSTDTSDEVGSNGVLDSSALANGCGTLASGATLTAGQSISSCKNGYRFVMQTDGNLVLYTSSNRALWSSRTNGKGGQTTVMQGDGNLVVYSYGNRDEHVALWASGTNGHPGAQLAIQNDGNVVIYNNKKPIWATNTSGTITIPDTKLCAKTHDGIPAYGYKSCADAGPFNVFTDDGIDTWTSSLGAGWKQSEGGSGYQCVELATRYFFATHNIDPFWSGVNTAPDMCHKHPSNVTVVPSPSAGDLIVIGGGTCGVSSTGHVAVIDSVSGDGNTLQVTQQNPANNGSYDKSCKLCFLHAR